MSPYKAAFVAVAIGLVTATTTGLVGAAKRPINRDDFAPKENPQAMHQLAKNEVTFIGISGLLGMLASGMVLTVRPATGRARRKALQNGRPHRNDLQKTP